MYKMRISAIKRAFSIATFAVGFVQTHLALSEEVVMVNVGPSQELLKLTQVRGLADAKKDILENKLYGYYLSQFGEENEDIKVAVLEKYHVYGKHVSCIPIDGQKEYSEAYDAEISKEILRRYGKDFWDSVDLEIEAKIKAKKSAH